MKISVILATCRRPHLLRATLESIARVDFPRSDFEVLVCDNAGEDEARDVCQSFTERIPIQYLVETATGKNAALNHAVDHAAGRLFVFTDDDVVVERDWLRQTWEGAERWAGHSVFGGRVLPRWPGPRPAFLETTPHGGVFFAALDPDLPEGPHDNFMPFGPNVTIRREVFLSGRAYDPEVGPSGRAYIMGSETEMLLRLAKEGYPAVFLPESCVHHHIRPEQYAVRWLVLRCVNYGRMRESLVRKGFRESDGRRLPSLGIHMLKSSARGLRDFARGNRAGSFDQMCEAAMVAGRMYQRAFGPDGSKEGHQ